MLSTAQRDALTLRLIDLMLTDLPEYRDAPLPDDPAARRRVLRGLMNVRPPMPLTEEALTLQDALLQSELAEKGIVSADDLPALPRHPQMTLWQGDITRLKADGIVNAANRALLGCFCPCHGCIDNAIHSAAGMQLRAACAALMDAQAAPEPTGRAKLTPGFNLPARYVLHTVGPIVTDTVTSAQKAQLADCYRSCLTLAEAHGLHSLAFCCISTGEFRFPNRLAAEIAIDTVTSFLRESGSDMRVIFNVFKSSDLLIYQDLLQQ